MESSIRINNDVLDFSRKLSYENVSEFQLHCHSFYEIYYYIGGNVNYMVEGKHYTLKNKTVFLLRPGVVHGVQTGEDKPYFRYAFHFMSDFVPVEHRDILLAPFYDGKICYENIEIEPLFDFVLECSGLPKKIKEIALTSRFEALLTKLYSVENRTEVQENSKNIAEAIVKYINEHITEEISLEGLANKFYISKSQLNRVFKKSMDTTAHGYISLKRANLARELLHRGETAENAAAASGFKDYSTFYRTYKKVMGHSPAETLNFTLMVK